MDINIIKQQLKAYKRVEISPELKSLSENQKQIIENLIGVEEAHGLANLIQLNFLKLNRVIELDPRTGLYEVDTNIFFEVIRELAKNVLMIELHGDYSEAMKFIDIYGSITSDTIESIEKVEKIPTDLDLKFNPSF